MLLKVNLAAQAKRDLPSLYCARATSCPSVHARLPSALCAQLGTKEAVGYFASWEDWNPWDNALGNLPSYVTTGAPAWRGRCRLSQASPLC